MGFYGGSLIETPQPTDGKPYTVRSDGYCPILIVVRPEKADSGFVQNFVRSDLGYASSNFKVRKFRAANGSSDTRALGLLKSIGFEDRVQESEARIDGETDHRI